MEKNLYRSSRNYTLTLFTKYVENRICQQKSNIEKVHLDDLILYD